MACNKSSVGLRSQYSKAREAAATKVQLFLEKGWEVRRKTRLDNDFEMENEVFWQTVCRLRKKRFQLAPFIKNSNGVILKDQNAILNRWREYFSDLSHPVDAASTEIHEEQVGEDIQITEADVNALKAEKAASEDEI